ncbi:hypothetical protein E2562_006424 [Oryza meyeriana var. granulata]|uniref:Uncharacterized protein n=1 Tax=Oryza meyeriana var. granulata TaxID=110450 RepID=A0A6G1EGL4_9ORYZ|nr:hypothetical protein E2562_006424 [Oryza meyeriana var. granulata]
MVKGERPEGRKRCGTFKSEPGHSPLLLVGLGPGEAVVGRETRVGPTLSHTLAAASTRLDHHPAGEMPSRRRDRRRPRDPSPEISRASTAAASSSSSSGPRFRPALLAPLLLLLLLVVAALHFSGRLSRPRAPTPQRKTNLSVYERGLVKRDVSASDIVAVRT